MKKIVGVIGGHSCTEEVEQIAQNLGKKLAKVVDILITGGLSGTIEAGGATHEGNSYVRRW